MEQTEGPVEAAEELEGPQINDALMASNVLGAHSIEHMYGRGFLVVLTTRLYDVLGLSDFQVSLLDGVRHLYGGVVSIGGGFFVDVLRHRRGQILAFSMALIGIGYFLVAVSPTYGVILAMLFLPAAGTALWHPPALALLAQRFPRRSGLFMSLHRSTGNIGDWAGSLLVGALLGVVGWRWIVGGGTPLLMVLAILLLLVLRNVGGPRPQAVSFGSTVKTQLHSLAEAVKHGGMGAIFPIFVVSALRSMADRPLFWMIPLYLSKELDKSDFVVGVHVALLAAPGIVSGPLFGALSDRVGRKAITAVIMAVSVVLPITMVLGGGGIGMTLSVAAFGLFMFSVNSLTQAAAIDVVRGRQLEGTFIGLMWGTDAFFAFGSSLAAGKLADIVSRQAVFYFASALFVVGFLASLAMPSGGNPHHSTGLGPQGPKPKAPIEGAT